MYSEDELLMLSGIQHIAFCERQWALIHVEQQWNENVLTLEGQFLHEKADDPFFAEWRNTVLTLRSVPLVSYSLGLTGRADIVQVIVEERNKPVNQEDIESVKSLWKTLRPVEYKRGKPKPDDRDQMQLCAQAICIEEMFSLKSDYGFLFYGEIRRREKVLFTTALRSRVKGLSEKMHQYFDDAFTPLPVYKSHCKSCSLNDICLPAAFTKAVKVDTYLNENLLSI